MIEKGFVFHEQHIDHGNVHLDLDMFVGDVEDSPDFLEVREDFEHQRKTLRSQIDYGLSIDMSEDVVEEEVGLLFGLENVPSFLVDQIGVVLGRTDCHRVQGPEIQLDLIQKALETQSVHQAHLVGVFNANILLSVIEGLLVVVD